MPTHKYNSIREVFMSTIGFLKYAELDAESVLALNGEFNGVDRAFLSPDVHSLDLVWVNKDGSIQAEIADYPSNRDGVSLTDFLTAEVSDDSQNSWDEGEHEGVYSIMSDFNDWTPENTPLISLKTLVEAEAVERNSERAKTAKLFLLLDHEV